MLLFSNWHHGSPYRIEMNNGDEHSYTLEGERFNYLDQEKQCTNETFEDQWWPSLAKTDFSGCEYQCLPFYIPASDMEVCDWNKTEDEVRHCNGLKVCINLMRQFYFQFQMIQEKYFTGKRKLSLVQVSSKRIQKVL